MVKLTYRLATRNGIGPGVGITDDATAKEAAPILAAFNKSSLGVTYPYTADAHTPDVGQRINLDFVLTIARQQTQERMRIASQVSADTADLSMSKFFTWVASNFMTGNDTAVMDAALWNAGVAWKPLSTRYVSEKTKLGVASGFWRFSGKLVRQFTSGNSKRRGMFGGTSATLKEKDGVNSIGISLGPLLNGVFSSGTGRVTTGQALENTLITAGFGGNEEMARKLQGRAAYYRPLLGPALLYYVDKVVKADIVKALKNAGFNVRKGIA